MIARTVLFFALTVSMYTARANEDNAAAILTKTHTTGGIVVCIGADEPEVLLGLAPDQRFLVHCIDTDAEKVAKAQSYIQSRGRYGQISVDQFDGKTLPYSDNLINLVVDRSGEISKAEVMRVLSPLGTAYEDGKTTTKPWPDDIREWTHWLQGPENNAVAGSRLTEHPRHMQWIQEPLWIRHHNLNPGLSALVSAKGRVFYILDEAAPGTAGPDKWRLIARDAFNGTLLWKAPIQDWGWRFWAEQDFSGAAARFKNPHQVLRRLVAVDDKVFVTLGIYAPVSMLDAVTGKVLRTYKGTEKAYEISYLNGMLVLAVNKNLDNPDAKPDVSVMGVNAQTGEILWERGGYTGVAPKYDALERYVDTTLTCGDHKAYIVDQKDIIGIDLSSGKELWRVPRPEGQKDVKKLNNSNYQYYYPDLPALVYHDGIVFFSQILHTKSNLSTRGRKQAVLFAIETKTGEKLWSFDCFTLAHFTPPDIFVIGGLVWALEESSASYVGLDLRTGKKKKACSIKDTMWDGGHHNCYRNKASERLIYTAKEKGNDLVYLESGKTSLHNWVKGACRYGIMPANGMLYFPSHNCRCYMSSKLNGFLALAPLAKRVEGPSTAAALVKGPAYKTIRPQGEESPLGSWPAFRHDNLRSNQATTSLAPQLALKWTAKLGRSLTQPVVAGQHVFVADTDTHTLYCLNRETGKTLWRYIACGKIDSSPSWYRGLLVFGCRDGYIYCLDAASGELAWKFRAAPMDLRISAFGQLESTWPAFGSQIVQDGKVYCCAGRSMHLSTGVYLYTLDVKTGAILTANNITADLKAEKEMSNAVLTDILVGDSKYLHMRGFRIDAKTLKPLTSYKWTGKTKQTDLTAFPYIKAYSGFLDTTWYNAAYLLFQNRPHAGHLLVLDADAQTTFTLQGYQQYLAKGSFSEDVMRVGQQGYNLAAHSFKGAQKGTQKKVAELAPGEWSLPVPLRGYAMVADTESLFFAGVKDQFANDADPWQYIEGRAGGILKVFEKKTGNERFTLNLESAPRYDGMSAAYGCLFISCHDGTLICTGK
jgi:outer membrane protein assembly factor BamB